MRTRRRQTGDTPYENCTTFVLVDMHESVCERPEEHERQRVARRAGDHELRKALARIIRRIAPHARQQRDRPQYVRADEEQEPAQARRADNARAHGAEERQVAPAAVDGVQVVRQRISVEEVLRAAGGGVWVGGAGRPESACEVLMFARGISEGSVRARGLSLSSPAVATRARRRCKTLACGLLLGLGAHAHD